MNRTGIPYLDFAWNPCGFGCSRGCPTCWARRQATSKGPTAPACPDCRQFRVHFHPERLAGRLAPAARKKPAVVGVQFLGDLFDAQRHRWEMMLTLDACLAAPEHEYVFLTRQVDRCITAVNAWALCQASETKLMSIVKDHLHIGVTCTTQAAYDDTARTMGNRHTGQWWVSAEPLATPLELRNRNRPTCIVVGADNTLAADCGVTVIRQTARAFAAAGVKVYIKQMWLWRCLVCRATYEDKAIGPSMRCACGTPANQMVPSLETDPAKFPADLRSRELPWTLTLGKRG